MDSLGDLLGSYSPKEPDEIHIIKQYIHDQFSATSSVALQGETIIITVYSAALANTLRMRTVQLIEASGTSKRLIFRIG